MQHTNFYLAAPSDASMLLYPDNHGGQFTMDLPTTLHLNAHGWEVGLSEIIFNQDWSPLIASDLWALVCMNDATGGTWSQCGAARVTQKEAQQTYHDFKDCWAKVLLPLIQKAFALAKLPKTVIKMIMVKDTIRLQITIKDDIKRAIKLELSHALIQILGFSRAQLTDGKYFLTNAEKIIDTKQSWFAPSIERCVSSLWIYCDIIRPQITGHTFSPLLRVIPVEANRSHAYSRVITFEKPHYFPLNMDNIDRLSIKITNIGGIEVIHFATPVVCMLHFRRIK